MIGRVSIVQFLKETLFEYKKQSHRCTQFFLHPASIDLHTLHSNHRM